MIKRSILVVMAVLFVACVSGFAIAKSKGNVYSNKFVGLSFSVPDGWYIATDTDMTELMPDAARVMKIDDNPAAKAAMAQLPGIMMLMVSERPFGSSGLNRNIAFVAINVSENKNDVSSGADYLGHVARGMRESQPSATVSNIITQRLGGEEFHRLNVSFPMQGITVYMSQLARINNNYIVILNMSAESMSSLTELVQIVDSNMRLSAVPQAVDSSPEGKSFRKQSSLNISGQSRSSSSGSNLLKNLGLILMFLGGYWFIKGLFIKNESKQSAKALPETNEPEVPTGLNINRYNEVKKMEPKKMEPKNQAALFDLRRLKKFLKSYEKALKATQKAHVLIPFLGGCLFLISFTFLSAGITQVFSFSEGFTVLTILLVMIVSFILGAVITNRKAIKDRNEKFREVKESMDSLVDEICKKHPQILEIVGTRERLFERDAVKHLFEMLSSSD